MQQLELKESFGAEAIETARAFANAHGGFIVIGVSDDRNRRSDNTLAFAKKGDAVRGHRGDPPRAGVRAG